MKSTEFRKELKKVMPGYKWTVHQTDFDSGCGTGFLEATGVQTKGYNRLSTLSVARRENGNNICYTVRSSGFGRRAPWLSSNSDGTLARALRGLQDNYEHQAKEYSNHAYQLGVGRVKQALQKQN